RVLFRSVLLADDLGPVRRVTLNRPKALNALNGPLTDALSEAIRAAGSDPSVSVVILRGAGRAFCAGYDLTEDAEGGVVDAQAWHRDLSSSMERMLEIVDCPKPVIASVQSYCLAGGTDLMLACDLAVAADDAYFGYVDVRFGSGWCPCSSRGSSGSGRRRSCCSPVRIGSRPPKRIGSVWSTGSSLATGSTMPRWGWPKRSRRTSPSWCRRPSAPRTE